MACFGAQVAWVGSRLTVDASASYTGGQHTVEGDWSGAAFPLCAAALSGQVTMHGLNEHSTQGDKAIAPLLAGFGAKVSWQGDVLHVQSDVLHGQEIDVRHIPDLVPPLCVVAAAARGETHIRHAGRLRMKESDRLAAMEETLSALGADIRVMGDDILIRGKDRFLGGSVRSLNDHRIAMSAAIAAIVCTNSVAIRDPWAVKKSYPGFYEDIAALGAQVQWEDEA